VDHRQMRRYGAGILAVGTIGAALTLAQEQPASPSSTNPSSTQTAQASAYEPKFPGDPARSESEAQALAYMRTALRAERAYKKKHDKYTDSLAALAGTGSFTKRLAQTPDRGDYTASYHPHKDGFVLTMTPQHMDGDHRSFYAEDDGVIHGDDQKAADLASPKVK
jgi:hypothetical protein